MRFTAIDIDDVEQALEIACGDTIGNEIGDRRTASDRDVARLRSRLKRFLAELPADTSVSELLNVMEA